MYTLSWQHVCQKRRKPPSPSPQPSPQPPQPLLLLTPFNGCAVLSFSLLLLIPFTAMGTIMSEAAPVALPPPADRPFSSSSNPVCPAGTFSRVGNEETRDGDSNSNVASQKHEHCVCPDSHICEGCEQGCTRDRPPLKKRCVSGFKPGCTSCRCRQRETNWGVVRPWGAMADLRNAPLCPNLLGKQNQQQG